VSCPLICAEKVTVTNPDPVISNMLFAEARPVEVSKPAVDPGINPVALLEPEKGDTDAAPVPVAEPPGTGTSELLAVLEAGELLN